MDDRNFDLKTAEEWIEIVEGEKSRVRDSDLYPHLRTWVNDVSPIQILDIGCGQGICSDKFDFKSCRYTGVEPSAFLLDRARHLYKDSNKNFISGNAYSLPFSDGHFDAAFSISVWHLLENKKQAAIELSRVLKGNGHFLIAAANPAFYDEWTSTYANSKREGVRFEGTSRQSNGTETTDVLFLHSYDEIIESLSAVQLKVLEVTKFRTAISIQGQKLAAPN